MQRTPDWLDRLLRAPLRWPGAMVEWLDGTTVPAPQSDLNSLAVRVRATARHPEAYLGLEPGLHHSTSDGAVVAWEHRGATAFAVGGLNTPVDGIGGLLSAFVDDTQRHGVVRQLAFPVRTEELDHVEAAGFVPVQVGVEARMSLAGLTWSGKRFVHVRQMNNRARKRGVVPREVALDACRAELEDVYAAWLDSKRPSWRMKLLVGSPGFETPFDRRYFEARSGQRVEAFVTVLPGPEGVWGLDVLARRPDAVAGTMERLFVHVMETLRDEGATCLSLGACPMAGVPFSRERPILTGLFVMFYGTRLGNRLFGFRNLWAFKQKFRPEWQPVYFVARPKLGVWALYRGCRMWGLY